MDATEIKQDADFIARQLVQLMTTVKSVACTLECQGDKLFGSPDQLAGQPAPAEPVWDNMPVLDLLNKFEQICNNLRKHADRF